MPLTDAHVRFTEIGTTTSFDLEVYIMPVETLDVVGRDINGMTYTRDVAVAAYVQEVRMSVFRGAMTRDIFQQLWWWMTHDAYIQLQDLANEDPITYYNGRISKLDPEAYHYAKISKGPHVITFKPDEVAGPI